MTNTATGPFHPGPDYIHIALGTDAPRVLAVDSSLTVLGLPPGALTVHADLLRPQCTVPATAIPVTISSDDTTRVHLDITCQVIWGFLAVALPTTGPNQPSLLTVTVDGQTKGGASPNTAGLGFPYILAGTRSVGLTGYGANCQLAETNPQQATVPLDDTVHVTFTLTCS